jgi:hypothetical protein
VKAFFAIERAARLKLDRLESAAALKIWRLCPAIDLRRCMEFAKVSSVSA